METFTYMFKDKAIWLKGLLVSLYMAVAPIIITPAIMAKNIPFIFVGGILWIAAFLTLTGYMINCIQTITEKKKSPILPYIKPKDIGKGCKLFVAQLIYNILAGLIGGAIGVLFIIPVVNILAFILYFAFLIFILLITPMLIYIFTEEESFLSMVQWKKAIIFISKNPVKYMQAFLYIIILLAVNGVFLSPFIIILSLVMYTNPNALLPNTLAIILLLIGIFIISIYSFFVYSYIIANCSDGKIR